MYISKILFKVSDRNYVIGTGSYGCQLWSKIKWKELKIFEQFFYSNKYKVKLYNNFLTLNISLVST